MTSTPSAGIPTLSGRPVAASLRDAWGLSRQLVEHFIEHVASCGTLPDDVLHGDVVTVTRVCVELATSMFDGRDTAEQVARVRAAATEWAREGIPIDTIQRAVFEGVTICFDLVFAQATADDHAVVVPTARRLLEVFDAIASAVSLAYVKEFRAVVSEHHTAVHTLTSALLGGHPTATMARECGLEIAPAYHVLALSIPPHRDEGDPRIDGRVVARRKLRRVQAELATRCGESALSLLSVDGGTILLPAPEFDDDRLDDLTARLARAAQVPIRATVVHAAPEEVPGAADRAHELLDIVHRLDCVPGLYRFDDLALEYQLTRPGPGREYLGSLLDSLDDYPDLLVTLQRHIANNMNRQRTARTLHVHTNTIDYRLKRVGQLTGFDPNQPSGLWYLRSALVARSYRSVRGG
ncbi:helix-turn-helix domain-containing protein [Nocardia terpenica]|uniref:Transcriptional regulator n=1 Tax=Nocardia terpenica TaxID=455432 RepID=A0A164MAP5_9NOCA|nr:helix-turn-helix domain-containing protein [Nocardia terpenica]KZM73195.1 transcriptional regulator [Nocardia terpenica]MBF6064216.1 helix-turn-helix domain-containing protein [Nocardia terpenica]MBF6106549.1 helix-turn-helix domain-containing protein [Nocardia terpenica]MBF6113834.1 helix-turn-helix domain-containing protein [Nocardia terpenica]MBF6120542.1 helix-turn-helix domain-containing protein [Nocardia terpenica]